MSRSFEVLSLRDEAWTARAALDLLPENNGPRVEVLRGCVVVTPGCGHDRRVVRRELAYGLRQSTRPIPLWVYHSVNIISGDDLFIPDLVVLRTQGGGRTAMDVWSAVLFGEIGLTGSRRTDVIDRPREYAAAGVPFFLRVDLRNRVPTIALFQLVEGEYRLVAAAAAGSTFAMREPFEFSIDPADLLDDEEPEESPGSPSEEPLDRQVDDEA